MFFPCREEGNVLVCTDAAARGLDIPAVSHIVQADFASTAVDFLHRVSAVHPRICSHALKTLNIAVNHIIFANFVSKVITGIECTGQVSACTHALQVTKP